MSFQDTQDFLRNVEVKEAPMSLWNLVMADLRAKAHIVTERVVPLRAMPEEHWEIV